MKTKLILPIAVAIGFMSLVSISPAADQKPPIYPNGGPPAATPKPIQVLLVTGVDYPGHKWQLTAPALAQQLRKDPRMDVRVVDDPHFLDSSAINRYDVVVLHFMNWKEPDPGSEARANLKRFVDGGKGVVLVHFACGAFMDWPEFIHIAGKVWNPKLRGHDKRGPFKVEIVKPDHPITKGMSTFETDDELYTCLDGNVPVEVLAKATSNVDHKDYAMAFVLNVGKGRAFHSPLGHDEKAFALDAVGELFRRGTAWAAGKPAVAEISK